MKRASLILALLLLIPVALAGASQPRHDRPEGATPLLPDLRTKPSSSPGGLQYGFSKKTGSPRVMFETRTSNIGRGPFEIQADPMRKMDCDGDGTGGDFGVRQVIYHDLDGNRLFNRLVDAWVDWEDSGCIYEHKAHTHWHFEDLNTSFLARKGKVVSRVQKNSWCLMDMRRASVSVPLPWEEGAYYGNMYSSVYDNCSGPRVLQGLSPGWDDIYSPGTPGQFIDVQKIASGNYCLVTIVDQKGVIRESNENNNRTGTPIHIDKKKQKVSLRSGSC